MQGSSGLIQVKKLLTQGFYYNNLREMARQCESESDPDHMLTAFVLSRIFHELAEVIEDQPYEKKQGELESKYKDLIDQVIQKTLDGSEEQYRILKNLIVRYLRS